MLKKSFTELFYITLLISALRPPDNSLLYPRESNFWFGQSDTFGPIAAENFNSGYQYPGLLYNDFHLNSKSNILLHETLDVLEEINSLGRYSQPLHNSRLFAYPVSSNSDETLQSAEETTESITSSGIASDDLFAQFENINFNDLDSSFFDVNEDFLLGNDSNSALLSGENGATSAQTTRTDGESVDVDDLLANSSVMFPTLDSTNGDVNDLFGELELLLSNETDTFGQEWQNFYTPLTSTETTEYPTIYDPNNISTDARNIENCTIYENGNSNGQIVANPTGSFSNNFGAVLYSSLTTLSNGNEHLNAELPSATNLAYNSSEISDLAYMSNLSNVSINNVTNPECFYNSYIPEDEFNLTDVNTIAASQYTNYPNGTTNYTSQEPVINPANHSQFITAASEDCFDKSSDSAVSSMSSDRVHSYSDNDWAETSSESSSYNGEANISDYQNNENKCNNAAAQKKYRLFGKNKSGDFKNSTQVPNYYDYPQVNFTYSNTCPPNSNENYNQLNYYQSTVSHNHTYAQSQVEVAPLSLMSSNIPTSDWSASESFDDSEANKKAETSRSTKSNNKKQQINIENIRKDPHLNRDEKRARSLKIPITTQDIINLPIDEFNERLTKYDLTEIQLSLIRDIRRRGKNKVAAQNCRKRKLDQIMGLQSEVDNMFTRKSSLETQYNELLMLRELARDKYTKLYQFVVEASSSQQPFFDLTTSPPDFPDKDSSADVQLNDNGSNSFMVSNNISSPVHLSSYGVQNNFSKQE